MIGVLNDVYQKIACTKSKK